MNQLRLELPKMLPSVPGFEVIESTITTVSAMLVKN